MNIYNDKKWQFKDEKYKHGYLILIKYLPKIFHFTDFLSISFAEYFLQTVEMVCYIIQYGSPFSDPD